MFFSIAVYPEEILDFLRDLTVGDLSVGREGNATESSLFRHDGCCGMALDGVEELCHDLIGGSRPSVVC